MRNRLLLSSITTALMTCAGLSAASFPDAPKVAPADEAPATIVLAGGCFWGMQGVFEHMKGVTGTVVGYAGGTKETAHYDMVSERNTGHAEAIKINWDPAKISLGEILKVYFSAAHDPTTLNRQENDVGPEYRSAIFYNNDEQKKLAETYVHDLNNAHVFRSPIVTQIVPLKGLFFPAEAEHQHFLDRNPTQGYIAAVDIPKLNGFKAKYPEYYTKEIK